MRNTLLIIFLSVFFVTNAKAKTCLSPTVAPNFLFRNIYLYDSHVLVVKPMEFKNDKKLYQYEVFEVWQGSYKKGDIVHYNCNLDHTKVPAPCPLIDFKYRDDLKLILGNNITAQKKFPPNTISQSWCGAFHFNLYFSNLDRLGGYDYKKLKSEYFVSKYMQIALIVFLILGTIGAAYFSYIKIKTKHQA